MSNWVLYWSPSDLLLANVNVIQWPHQLLIIQTRLQRSEVNFHVSGKVPHRAQLSSAAQKRLSSLDTGHVGNPTSNKWVNYNHFCGYYPPSIALAYPLKNNFQLN